MKKLILLSFLILFSCEKDPVQYTLSVTSNPPQGGYVNPTTGVYNMGEAVTISAASNEFYKFKNWSGSWAGSSASIILVMDGDKMIIANFEKIDIDEDGVNNENDLCGNTPSGLVVDSTGCAASQRDTDGDGVTDDLDQCQNTDINSAIINSSGCKVDLFYKVSGFDNNRYTIKAIEQAEVGMEDKIDGITYKLINLAQLKDMIQDGDDLSNIVTSKIKNMSELFKGGYYDDGNFINKVSVVGDISHWDVSNVTDMSYMFYGTQFNQEIEHWDVSNVTDMSYMFYSSEFNDEIADWDVSNVTNMVGMFGYSKFNQEIRYWDVSNVTDMSFMFRDSDFDKFIGYWDVSNVESMRWMFLNTNFNWNINLWDVSKVTNMSLMFKGSKFNGPISDWDVSNVTDMSGMFESSIFNGEIADWDVSNVTSMKSMFRNSAFNSPIDNWDVSNVTDMSYMFYLGSFGQNIENWDVSSVTDMSYMFYNSLFNNNISNWDVNKVFSCSNFHSVGFNLSEKIPNFTNCNPD